MNPPFAPAPMSSTAPLGSFDLLRLVLLRRRWLIAVPCLIAGAVAVSGLTGKRSWTASAAMIAHASGANVSRLAGLAAQFGVNVPSGQSGQSPEYYADVLRSDGMLRRLLAARYSTADGAPVDLAARLVPGMNPGPERSELAMRAFRHRVSASAGLKTGIVRLTVKLDDPEVARQVAALAIDQLNLLNIESQQGMAALERRFTDERLALARRELRQAEDRLESFLRGNRLISGGPGLVLQEERLRRDVNLRQQVMVGLAQALEQSRLEEVRNVPVMSVVEPPVRPALPDSRKLVLKALFAAIASAALTLAILLCGEWRRRFAISSPAASAEVEQLARDAASDLRRPWRLFSSRRPPDGPTRHAA